MLRRAYGYFICDDNTLICNEINSLVSEFSEPII